MIWLLAAAGLLPSLASAGVSIAQGRLQTDQPVTFSSGTAELSADSEAVLLSVKDFLTGKSYITLLRVEGHVASGGEPDASQRLSEARARAVADWLSEHGVDCRRLLPVGFGATKPVADNAGPERAQNNRIEFAPAELRGHAIGGMPVDGGGHPVAGFCATTSN